MKISPSQQQLLYVLNIPALQLKQQFSQHHTCVTTASVNSPTEIDLHSSLAQDIVAALGDLDWQIDIALTHSHVQHLILHTPALAALRTPQLKQQLWRVLADNGNTSDIKQADAGAN